MIHTQSYMNVPRSTLVTFPMCTLPGRLGVRYPLLKKQTPPVRVGYLYLYIYYIEHGKSGASLPIPFPKPHGSRHNLETCLNFLGSEKDQCLESKENNFQHGSQTKNFRTWKRGHTQVSSVKAKPIFYITLWSLLFYFVFKKYQRIQAFIDRVPYFH